MEENLKTPEEILRLQPVDIRAYSPLTLAYIGDGAYDLAVPHSPGKSGKLQAS